MTLEERAIEALTLIRVAGRVTVNQGADVLGDRLRQLMEEGCTKFLIDFGDVPYVDSTALKLLRVRGHVRELLEVTQLLSVFETFESDAEAVASFSTSA